MFCDFETVVLVIFRGVAGIVKYIFLDVDGLSWRLFVVSTGSGGDCSWCRWVVVEIVRRVDG